MTAPSKTRRLCNRQDELMELWESGKNDCRIADEVGCTPPLRNLAMAAQERLAEERRERAAVVKGGLTMQEILFRGFCLGDGGPHIAIIDGLEERGRWVRGFYVGASQNAPYHEIFSPPYSNNPFDRWNRYIVEPSTVGQYTGLTDKNGKKIFEGDILQVENPKPFSPYKAAVVYENTSFRWGASILGEFDKPESLEIIGTIYDVPP